MKWKSHKKILYLLVSILSFGFVATILSIKLTNPYKSAFYIYSSYVDDQTKKEIDKKYSLKEYGDFNSFDYAIRNHKVIAGITSDYLIINLIKDGKIAPISREIRLLYEKKHQPLNEDLSSYFTKETQDQMQQYNNGFGGIFTGLVNDDETQNMLRKKYPEYCESNPNYVFKIEDFIVPYFINDRVYAFDTKKILGKLFDVGTEKNPLGLQLNNKGLATSTVDVLKKMFEKGKDVVIQWTKNEIENSIIGSEYNNLQNFNTQISEQNYFSLVNNFDAIVKAGTKVPMSNNQTNIFEPDSDVILNNLINPASRIKAAILYNGDALDAYYGHDNFKEIKDGDRLRIVRTENNIRVLDAFIVSSDTTQNQRESLISFFDQHLFNNMFTPLVELEKKYISPTSEVDPQIWEQNGIARIFDYVKYTPSALGIFEFIKKYCFKLNDGTDDLVALDIFEVKSNGKPIAPFDKQVYSKLVSLFQKRLNG